MAKFLEVTVNTTHIGGEIVSDILWNYTESGVVVLDLEDVLDFAKTDKTYDYIDEKVLKKDKTVLVKGYLPIESAFNSLVLIERQLLELKKDCEIDLGTLEISKREIDGDSWHEDWKKHFKPLHIGNVVVVPEWIEYTPKDNEITILLDSNMAFGTGEHETTSMCIEYMQKYVEKNTSVIDVGCGSGILGITASKLGAKKVLLTDIDEVAVKSSIHNLNLNGIENGEVLLKNLLDDSAVKGDLIVCNIMAEVLIAFSKDIAKNLNEKGVIILSGILKERLSAVKQAYLENGFNFMEEKIKGEWSALVMQVK